MRIDFEKYRIKFPESPKAPKLGVHKRYYKDKIKEIRKGFPKI